MCLPAWQGAAAVYGRLMTVAETLQQRAYKAQRAQDKRARFRFSPDPDACEITKALGAGNEEQCKALLYAYRDVRASN